MRKYLVGAWFGFHFACLIAVSLYQTVRLIVLSKTIITSKVVEAFAKLSAISEGPLGSRVARSGPVRQSLMTYLACAGADGGYGYFAPGVPDTYELTFELHYSDGRSETQIARSSNSALGIRVASLIEQIGGIPSPKLREHMLKKFATVFSREHSEVKEMRVSLWQVTPPTIEEYAHGKRQKPALLCFYDFNQAAMLVPAKSQ